PSAIKQEPYISLNPNGRLPAIEDPNTGLVLWESGAIVQYLVEQYDKDAKLRYTTFAEKWQQEAWKIFQVSGQGPYFGQLMWFKVFHSEKLPSAVDRYTNEAKRVLGVIDAHLKKTKTSHTW
ncbi:glutathione S- transferase, nitrogen catabolite repression regulator, partial [Friedmanniomyces endolithicus]